jgi:hypothetical protein
MLEQKRFSGRHLLTFESQKLNYFGKKSGAGVLTLAHRHLFLVIFFQEFNIRLYDKNSESDYFFFPQPKSEYFFQQHWESEYLFRKKPLPPPPFKLNGRSLIK